MLAGRLSVVCSCLLFFGFLWWSCFMASFMRCRLPPLSLAGRAAFGCFGCLVACFGLTVFRCDLRCVALWSLCRFFCPALFVTRHLLTVAFFCVLRLLSSLLRRCQLTVRVLFLPSLQFVVLLMACFIVLGFCVGAFFCVLVFCSRLSCFFSFLFFFAFVSLGDFLLPFPSHSCVSLPSSWFFAGLLYRRCVGCLCLVLVAWG